MDFGNVLGQIAVGAGNALIYGQKYQAQQAEMENNKANTAMHKMSVLASQQEIADRSRAATDFKASMQGSADLASADAAMVNAARETANKAAQVGDFKTMKAMSELAKGAQDALKETALAEAKKVELAQEGASNTAQDFLTNPSAETARIAVQKALLAGTPPEQIPPSTDKVAFGNYMKMQAQRAMGSEKRVEFMQKTIETEKLRTETERSNRAKEVESTLSRQALARDRDNDNALNERKFTYQKEQDAVERLDRAAKVGAFVKTHPSPVESGIHAIVGSAAEAMRGANLVAAMAKDQTASPFSGLHNGTMMQSLVATAGNLVTPQTQKLYEVATGGLGLEVSRTLTLGAGRSGSDALQKEMQRLLTTNIGESEGVAMFKITNAVDLVRNRVDYLATADDPSMKEKQEKLKSLFKNWPTPDQVYHTLNKEEKARALSQGSRPSESMREAMDRGFKLQAKGDSDAIRAEPAEWAKKKAEQAKALETVIAPAAAAPAAVVAPPITSGGWSIKLKE